MNFRSLVFALAVTGSFASASAANTAAPQPSVLTLPSISIKAGKNVVICRQVDSRQVCDEGRMPSAVGDVDRILPGVFLEATRASWIVLSGKRASVCALSAWRPIVICGRIHVPKNMSDFDINATKGVLLISRVSRTKHAPTKQEQDEFVAGFLKALSAASAKVQDQLVKAEEDAFDRRSSGATQAITYGLLGEDEEPDVDEDMPDGGFGDVGGGDAGSDSGETGEPGAEQLEVAMVVVVTAPRPAPPPPSEILPPPPAPLTLCGQFGIFCSQPDPEVERLREIERKKKICDEGYATQMSYCDAFYKINGARWWSACTGDAADVYTHCLRNAESAE